MSSHRKVPPTNTKMKYIRIFGTKSSETSNEMLPSIATKYKIFHIKSFKSISRRFVIEVVLCLLISNNVLHFSFLRCI